LLLIINHFGITCLLFWWTWQGLWLSFSRLVRVNVLSLCCGVMFWLHFLLPFGQPFTCGSWGNLCSCLWSQSHLKVWWSCQFPFLPPQSFQIPCRLVRPIQAMLARTFGQKKKPPNPLLLSSNWSLCSKKSYLFGYLNTYHWHNLMIKNIKETFYARPFKFKNFPQPTGYSHVSWWVL